MQQHPETNPTSTAAPDYQSAPHRHVPRLVMSAQQRGDSVLAQIALAVNQFVGSMWLFVIVTTGIVVWLFAGNVVGFDRTPWPLLLTILNLPQLSIMISLQVSATISEKVNDARAVADHETLIALHQLAKQQLDILNAQNEVLDLLRKAARA